MNKKVKHKIEIGFDDGRVVKLPNTPESRALVLSAVAGGVLSWLNGIKGFNEAMTRALNKRPNKVKPWHEKLSWGKHEQG